MFFVVKDKLSIYLVLLYILALRARYTRFKRKYLDALLWLKYYIDDFDNNSDCWCNIWLLGRIY